MAQLLITKGPGRFELMIAYWRGRPEDFVRCHVTTSIWGEKADVEVVMDIHQAIPTTDKRDEWRIKGIMTPVHEYNAHQRGVVEGHEVNWILFEALYRFKMINSQPMGLGQTLP